jgi:hypothetical protein
LVKQKFVFLKKIDRERKKEMGNQIEKDPKELKVDKMEKFKISIIKNEDELEKALILIGI